MMSYLNAKSGIVVVSRLQHISFLPLNSVSFCAGGGGNLSVMASKRGNSPSSAHYTDSSLISHKGKQPPHEFGHCSPLGPGQASFYNSGNDAEISFQLLI